MSVFSSFRFVELTYRFLLSEVIKYSLPYLSIPSIEKEELRIVETIDLSCLTSEMTPTTYELSSITKSFSLRFRFSPPEIMYWSVRVLNIIEDSKIS